MPKRCMFALILLLACLPCNAQEPAQQADHVLFVGNSLIYVGNLPAVFSALANANGHPVRSDMIVQGGATLDDRVRDGSVVRALATNQYTTMILQERSGHLMCSLRAALCLQSQRAIKRLAKAAHDKGATTILLGTYQQQPWASLELVEGESRAAARAGIAYIEVWKKLQHLHQAEPELDWYQADRIHPGKDLTLLDAILIYRQLFGTVPEAKSFTVNALIYADNSGQAEDSPTTDATHPKVRIPTPVTYSSATIERLLAGMDKDDSG